MNVPEHKLQENIEDLYWEKGLPLASVAKKLNISQNRLRLCMTNQGVPTRNRSEALKLSVSQNRNSNTVAPDLSPSPELAYVLGVIQGDGYLHKYRYSISLSTVDEEFADAFYSSLESINLNPFKNIRRGQKHNHRDQYVVTAKSIKFCNWFNKLSQQQFFEIGILYPNDFIRGVYDSEGSFRCYWENRKNVRRLKTEINIVNTNKKYIDTWSDILDIKRIKHSKRKRKTKSKHKDLWIIRISTREEILHFLREVEPTIWRKSLAKYEHVTSPINHKRVGL